MSTSPSPSQRLEATRSALDRHRDYLALLQAVSEAANEADSLAEVLADVIEMTCTSLGWPVGHAMTVTPEQGFKVAATDIWYLGEPKYAALRDRTERCDQLNVIDEAIATGEPRAYPKLHEIPDFLRRDTALELGLTHLFVGPIRTGERVVAVVEFFAPPLPNARSSSLRMLLGSLCTSVGRVAEREHAQLQHRKLMRAEFVREQAEQHAAELEQLTIQLRQRNAELDRFAYVASHDLRAPLRGIANLASWLAQDLDVHLGPDSRRHLELLQGRVQRMENLINGLLEYSRVGRKLVAPETVDTRELVAEVIDLLDATERARWAITELPTLETRRLPLRQILHNLIANALNYADVDELCVEIGAERVTLGSGRPGWRFRVRDNGRGIEPRYHERVWEIFQTLQPRDRIESTGIGLSLVRKIVEQQGGEVGLESALGEGATFSFTWPETIHD